MPSNQNEKMVVLRISAMKEDLMEMGGPEPGSHYNSKMLWNNYIFSKELLIVDIHTILLRCIITVTFGRQRNSILYNSDDKKLT